MKAKEQSDSVYKALIETTDTGYVVIDAKGRVLDANQAYVRMSGHKSLDEIRGRSISGWTASTDKRKNAEAVTQCLRDRRISNLDSFVKSPGLAVLSA